MGDHPSLSTGSLKAIMRGSKLENVVMQVLGSKKINAANNTEKQRYRLMLSDGVHVISYAMLTVQSGLMQGEISTYSIIKIKKYVTSLLANSGRAGEKKILVVLDLEILKDGVLVGHELGSPAPLTDNDMEENNENNVNRENIKTRRDSNEASAPPTKRLNITPSTSTDSMNLADQLVLPIASLTPYQNKWVIKARIMKKSDIRTWSNSRGEGKLFSMDVFDSSGEIRLTGFKEMVDKYYDYIQQDKVYYISKCSVKMANQQFNTMKNDYEMTMNSDTIIQECTDEDDQETPKIQYNFVTIDKIAEVPVGNVIDVIAVCKEVKDCQKIVARTSGKEMTKREIFLVDQSKTCVAATLWGADAELFEGHSQVIVMKGMRVNEFGGAKNLSTGMGAIIKVNPDIEEAFALRGWYDNGGFNEEMSNISARTGSGSYQANWYSFKDVIDLSLGNSEKGDYYQTKGTVLLIKGENMTYKACSNESCNKKVIDIGDGMYRCEKCDIQRDTFKYRLIGNWNIGDWSGNQWVSMFSEQCETILGKTSAEIGEMIQNDPQELQNVINNANFKQFIFRCRAKVETYNDEVRLRSTCVKVEPINYKEYDDYLISQIQRYIE